ncbi:MULTISPECIES: hypothetical protein [unclassified Streptomyces]|uniref:hypothetical protein n=1 Tax=unclassified Streptomyces TaxID=2593676 RepID=UPI002024D172|nr:MULTISPECIES: hypothetical protein [unclassified Streptomyces]MCX4550569.1 hypothetical protein [Streptomyces sp. NBC_01500]WSC22016.1 hypothetical protein OIE60_21310 [Streptomyces sp. NBC_01766]
MSGPTRLDMARRMSGGYGTGEGRVGLADRSAVPDEAAASCGTCPTDAVLYFVDSAEEDMRYACLEHAASVAYSVAVASTAGLDVPASERGADDRRWRR